MFWCLILTDSVYSKFSIWLLKIVLGVAATYKLRCQDSGNVQVGWLLDVFGQLHTQSMCSLWTVYYFDRDMNGNNLRLTLIFWGTSCKNGSLHDRLIYIRSCNLIFNTNNFLGYTSCKNCYKVLNLHSLA